MKYKLLAVILLISSLMLTGCASGPTYQDYAASIPPVPEDSGRFYIYRVGAFAGAIQPSLKVNNEIVGKAVPQGFFFIDRPAGNYVFSASTEVERSLSLTLQKNQERYIKLEPKMGLFVGHIKPVLVDNSVGKVEIVKTKYTGDLSEDFVKSTPKE